MQIGKDSISLDNGNNIANDMSSFFNLSDTIPPENRDESHDFFKNIFGNTNPLVVEIGSGNGHFLVKYAIKYPEKNFVGTETLSDRAKKFYAKIEKRGLKNIVVFKGDGRQFVWEYLYENSVQEFIILFPDPWPKKRHHKHRLLNTAFINIVHVRLVPGGNISIATDHEKYRDWIINEFNNVEGFVSLFKDGYSEYPDHYPKSLFEERLRNKGSKLYYLKYKKIAIF